MKLEWFKEIATHVCQLKSTPVIVAGVSGGPDSLCLLDLLLRAGFPVLVAHFDHRLRPGSTSDAAFVQAMAVRLGADFVLGEGDVAEFAQQRHVSVEEAARWMRYQFLFEQARRVGAQAVAVGHTADDQVETLMMHLLRGSGLTGLAGMPFRGFIPEWDAAIPLVRPLLEAWREDTLAHCAEHNLQPRIDETNQDVVYMRNRVRHELIPILERFNPQARRLLWRTSQIIAGDEEVIQQAVAVAWQECFHSAGKGVVKLRLSSFAGLLLGVQRRVLRQALAHLHPSMRDVDFLTVERGLRFLAQPAPVGRVDLVKGVALWVEGDRILLASPAVDAPEEQWLQVTGCHAAALPVPGCVALVGGWQITSEWVERMQAPDQFVGADSSLETWLDGETLAAPLSVRCPAPGDRFQPLGLHNHTLKLSDFWTNHKLPRRARANWPLVVSGESIIWVPSFRPAHFCRITAETRRVIHLKVDRVKQ